MVSVFKKKKIKSRLESLQGRIDECKTRFKSKRGQDLRVRDVSRTQEELCLQIIASSGSFLCSASSKLRSHFCRFDHAHTQSESRVNSCTFRVCVFAAHVPNVCLFLCVNGLLCFLRDRVSELCRKETVK